MFYPLSSSFLPSIPPLGVRVDTTGSEFILLGNCTSAGKHNRSMCLKANRPAELSFDDKGPERTSLVVAWGILVRVSCIQGVRLICELSNRDQALFLLSRENGFCLMFSMSSGLWVVGTREWMIDQKRVWEKKEFKKKKKRVKIEAQKQNEVESKRGAVKFVRLKVEIQMKTASTTRDEAGKHEND